MEQHRPFVWRVLRRLGLSSGEATRALDEVFGVLTDEPRFARPAQLRVLAGAAVRVAEQRRRTSVQPPALEAEPFDAEALPREEARALRDSLLLIDSALSALDAAQRAVFVLIELEGMTLDQVAVALEMSRRMTSSRLSEARVKFDLAARRLMEASERRARELRPSPRRGTVLRHALSDEASPATARLPRQLAAVRGAPARNT